MMADERDPQKIDPKHELPWPRESDPVRVGDDFADPKCVGRPALGEGTLRRASSACKKHHKPVAERVHAVAPKAGSRKPLF